MKRYATDIFSRAMFSNLLHVHIIYLWACECCYKSIHSRDAEKALNDCGRDEEYSLRMPINKHIFIFLPPFRTIQFDFHSLNIVSPFPLLYCLSLIPTLKIQFSCTKNRCECNLIFSIFEPNKTKRGM